MASSFTVAGLFVATIGFAIGLDGDLFRGISAVLLLLLGVTLPSTALQARLGYAAGRLTNTAESIIRRLSLSTGSGQFIVGLLLGLVWSLCAGPTLGAASLLAAQRKDLAGVAAVMLVFDIGTTLPMLAVATLSRNVFLRWRQRMLTVGQIGKVAMGASLLALGILILSGADRYVETRLVQASPAWLNDLTTHF